MLPATSRIAIFRWPHDRDKRHPVAIDHRYGLWIRPSFGEHTLLGVERGVRHDVEDPSHLDETMISRTSRCVECSLRGGTR